MLTDRQIADLNERVPGIQIKPPTNHRDPSVFAELWVPFHAEDADGEPAWAFLAHDARTGEIWWGGPFSEPASWRQNRARIRLHDALRAIGVRGLPVPCL